MNSNPNFRFCNFCNNRDPRDPCKFTHWVRNNETGETICPFLKATLCMECMEYGHTYRNCPNKMRIFQLEMNASLPFLPPKKTYMEGQELEKAKDLFDAEHEHNRYVIALNEELIRRHHMAVAIKTQFCDYCAFHHPHEQNTHVKALCPRLSMCVCTYCRKNGHTIRFCQKKKMDESRVEDEPEWELDFDII